MKLIYLLLSIPIILLFNIAVISVPFSIIWLVNYLFPIFSIPYSFISWIAVLVINFGFVMIGLKQIKEKL